ncbi:MAG: hypothetical protein H7Y38_14400, partial [Armatimonadetes bacterium]|nr:hypothetical protein [Armatimonadota bacterium]
MRFTRLVTILFCVCALTGARAQEPAPPPALVSVSGAVEKPGDWTVARLAAEFARDTRT